MNLIVLFLTKSQNNLKKKFFNITSMLMVLVALFSVELVYLLLDEKYFDTWVMIPLLSSAYIFRSLYCFSSSGLFFEKQTGNNNYSSWFGKYWLIPIYGLIYTTIFSFFLTFLMAELMSYKVYYLQLNMKKNLLILIYLFGSIILAININENFKEFGYLEYVYKVLILLAGLVIGYKLDLLNIKRLMKIRKG